MVAIVNQQVYAEDGRTLYKVKINDKCIAEFYHNPADGLAVCLNKASESVSLADRMSTTLSEELSDFWSNVFAYSFVPNNEIRLGIVIAINVGNS